MINEEMANLRWDKENTVLFWEKIEGNIGWVNSLKLSLYPEY